MAKTTLKIVDRKTTVPREKVRLAFTTVIGNSSKLNGKHDFGATKETSVTTNAPVAKKA